MPWENGHLSCGLKGRENLTASCAFLKAYEVELTNTTDED